jgi:hypothetical protein
MIWSPMQLRIIRFFNGVKSNGTEKTRPNKKWIEKMPMSERRFKCNDCHLILSIDEVINEDKDQPCCPKCKTTNIVEVCPLDHAHCGCNGGIPQSGIFYCPVCGEPICPSCATHDVFQLSRVTGYYQSVEGFNEAKKQELKDRHRTTEEEVK